MERLTDKKWRNLDPCECCGQDYFCKRGCHDDGGCNNGCIVPKLYDRLAAYEDAEEQGRLVVLPCKVGDMVWLNDMDGKPREMVLDSPDIRCHCKRDDEFSCCMPVCDNPKNGICAHRLKNDGSEIGKTVFLTREEAEAALRGGAPDV